MSVLSNLGADAATVLYDPTRYQHALAGDPTITGSAGYDVVFTPAADGLVTTGATLFVSGIECLVGGTKEALILTDPVGSTILTRGCETLVGGSGYDVIFLGDTANTFLTRMEEVLCHCRLNTPR